MLDAGRGRIARRSGRRWPKPQAGGYQVLWYRLCLEARRNVVRFHRSPAPDASFTKTNGGLGGHVLKELVPANKAGVVLRKWHKAEAVLASEVPWARVVAHIKTPSSSGLL